jgi:cytochrome c oxidase cbb3-type subunit IV
MTYETVQSLSALVGLLLFMTLFAGVLVYVFWPGNRQGFRDASLIPFDSDDRKDGAAHGR